MEKSEVAKEYRAKTELRKLAVVSVERDVSALRSPSAANRRNEDEQLTKQVQHLFTEKVMLQARLKELERENQHLSDEVEMLHTQVDEQADEVDAAYDRAMKDAADTVVEDFLAQQLELDAAREAEVAAAKAEADAVRERLGKLEADARREHEVHRLVNTALRNVVEGDEDGRGQNSIDVHSSPSRTASPALQPTMTSPMTSSSPMSSSMTPARERELHALQRRSEELQRHMETLRDERSRMQREVAALKAELYEKEEQTYADRESLAREVEALLSRQAELSANLAQVRREKEMLEEDNEVLYAKAEEETERARVEAEAAKLARTPSSARTPTPTIKGFVRQDDAGSSTPDGPTTPPTEEKDKEKVSNSTETPGLRVRPTAKSKNSSGWCSSDDDENDENDGTRAPPVTANATPAPHSPLHWRMQSQVTSPERVRVRAAAAAKKSIADGPDSELAAKLMRRLKRAGEENEAEALSEQVRTLQAEQATMRRAMAEVSSFFLFRTRAIRLTVRVFCVQATLEKQRMAEEMERLKEQASPMGIDAGGGAGQLFVNPLSPGMALGSPFGSSSPFGSDDGIMREREEAVSRRELELERELEARVRDALEVKDGELVALREECAAKDARIAELLAKVASAVA